MLPARPEWLRKRLPLGAGVQAMEGTLDRNRLHTICREACCPNQGECFSRGVATFLIMGRVCTRNCRFCAVRSGIPKPLDDGEPRRLAAEVKRLGLRFVVITSVTRDDLPDGGAGHFARAIEAVRRECPGTGVEVLIPDFQGSRASLETVVAAAPEVLNHNVETVPRLYRAVRPQADFRRSIELLRAAKVLNPSLVTKSGLLVGLGETRCETLEVMAALRSASCDVITIGQYLSPSAAHHPVAEYVRPEAFEQYRLDALRLGFRGAAASPFVRSSYRAETLYRIAGSGGETEGLPPLPKQLTGKDDGRTGTWRKETCLYDSSTPGVSHP